MRDLKVWFITPDDLYPWFWGDIPQDLGEVSVQKAASMHPNIIYFFTRLTTDLE
jgi:hypothetical protein